MVDVDDDTDLASELVVQAARLVRTIRREAELPAGTRVLSLLDQYGPLGVTALAVLDGSSQPTTSGAVAPLVAQGLVTKAPNPDDGRGTVVTLTAAGSAELARVREANGRRVAERLAAHHRATGTATTPDELATAVAVLQRVLGTDRTTPISGGDAP